MMSKSGHPIQATGLVLAGGQARRMQGEDKGLLMLAGKTLVEHCLTALSPYVQQIFISANRHLDQYEKFGFPVLQDTNNDYDGPLAGLQRALENSPELPVLVVPCDAPLLSELLAQKMPERLWNAYQKNDCLAAIPYDGIRLQPLFGLYAPSTLKSLSDYLVSGQRKVGTWVSSLPHEIVDFSDNPESFMNINTEDDLMLAKSLFSKAE